MATKVKELIKMLEKLNPDQAIFIGNLNNEMDLNQTLSVSDQHIFLKNVQSRGKCYIIHKTNIVPPSSVKLK